MRHIPIVPRAVKNMDFMLQSFLVKLKGCQVSRKIRFTKEQIEDALRKFPNDVNAAAKYLGKLDGQGYSRQSFLNARKSYGIIPGKLPPPTKEEKANIQKSHERKAEMTARSRPPTLDEITDSIIEAFKALREKPLLEEQLNRLKNRVALLESENKSLHEDKQRRVAQKLEFEQILSGKDS